MKKWLLAVGLLLGANTAMANPYLIDYFHPNNEPRGLFVVNFNYDGMYKTYRVYCPTKMVRDISNGAVDASRTATQEDRRFYGNRQVLRAIVRQVCVSKR